MNSTRKKGRRGILHREIAAAGKLLERYMIEKQRLGREIARTNGKTALGQRRRYGDLEHRLIPGARQSLAEVKLKAAQVLKPH